VCHTDLQQDISCASLSHQIERVLFRASFLCVCHGLYESDHLLLQATYVVFMLASTTAYLVTHFDTPDWCKEGRNHVGLGYYYPSTEKIRQVNPVCCSRLHNHTLFIKKLCKKLGVRPNFGEVQTPQPPSGCAHVCKSWLISLVNKWCTTSSESSWNNSLLMLEIQHYIAFLAILCD